MRHLRENPLRSVFYCAIIFHLVVYWGGLAYLGLFSYLGGIDFVRGYVVYENIMADLSKMYDTPFTLMYLPSAAIFIFIMYATLSPFISDLLLSVSLLALGMFFFNLLICWLIREITIHVVNASRAQARILNNPYFLMSIYILLPIHSIEYHIGQFNTLASFFLLLGLYCLIRGHDCLGFLAISTGTVIKVVLALFLFFLLLSRVPWRVFLKRVCFMLLPHVVSIVMIIAMPNLLIEFLNQILVSVNVLPPRFNMPANIVDFLRYNDITGTGTIVVISACIFALNVFAFLKYKRNMKELDRFFLVTMILINISPILYVTHLKIYLPIILIWLAGTKHDAVPGTTVAKLEMATKIIMIIPTVSIAAWMYYPYLFIIFLGVMGGNLALNAYSDKCRLNASSTTRFSTSETLQ